MSEVRAKYRERAWTAFERAVARMQGEFDPMLPEFAAKGRLGSGATIKAAIRVFEQRSAEALDGTLAEAAKLIEHRGRKWAAAMAGIVDALDQHLARAGDALKYPLQAGNRDGSEAAALRADELVSEAGTRLNTRLSDFRDGWTAPTPKLWKDRHPVWYALFLLVIGAVVGAAIRSLTGA